MRKMKGLFLCGALLMAAALMFPGRALAADNYVDKAAANSNPRCVHYITAAYGGAGSCYVEFSSAISTVPSPSFYLSATGTHPGTGSDINNMLVYTRDGQYGEVYLGGMGYMNTDIIITMSPGPNIWNYSPYSIRFVMNAQYPNGAWFPVY